jgi:ferredoxin
MRALLELPARVLGRCNSGKGRTAALRKRLRDEGNLNGSTLVYSNKTEADIIWRDKLSAMPGLTVAYTVTDEKGETVPQRHLNRDYLRQFIEPGTLCYLCGPPPMMRVITDGLEEWGVPETSVHYEAFGPATVTKTPQSKEAHATTTSGVKVEFARSGKTCTWIKEVGSILELAEAQGVTMDSGCRAGNCGTCLTAIKEGEVTYLNEPGVEPEKGSCLSCIAVPNGKLVLDA